jgi:threonylcarbamoyladenosine tRNA methylthiotransferase MtaB
MKKTFSIKTLGCKLNQYESSEIAGEFTGNGWEMRPFGEKVDVTIINTCTVTDATDKKCRGFIRQGARDSVSGKVIVTGCMAESGSGLSGDPAVSLVLGNREKSMVYGSAEELTGGKVSPVRNGTDISKPLPLKRSRASLKIQDGCDNFCSFCIVPHVRGKPESRNIDEIIDHAEKLIDEGYHELVLTGITIGKYRYRDTGFAGLVEKLIDLRGDYRIRITSIEPVDVTGQLIELYASERICGHIHLPLQSGSDRVLGLMNRKYSSARFMDLVEKIRSGHPELAVGSDLIVGFPGENEDDFAASINMMKRAGFAYTHCFPFSKRRGTPAANMKENIDSGVLSERVRIAKETASILSEDYRKQFLHRSLKSIIVKNEKTKTYTGISDNYIKIRLDEDSYPEGLAGNFRDTKILSVDRNGTYGIIET